MQIKTAGELRGFLADVLVGIQSGHVDSNKANAIAKVAAQINMSLATEVNTSLQLEKMGKGKPVAGSMLIATHTEKTNDAVIVPVKAVSPPRQPNPISVAPRGSAEKIWCDQCDMSVTTGQAVSCKSAFCKAKEAA